MDFKKSYPIKDFDNRIMIEKGDSYRMAIQDKPKWGISGSTLKIIAIITMLIDHIGAALLEQGFIFGMSQEQLKNKIGIDVQQLDIILRMIGRVAFPIFCFLLVEGFLHTHNVKKYALRLLAFCVISEVPFDLAFFGRFNFRFQNVFFTLFLGLIVLIISKKLEDKVKGILGIVGQILVMVIGAFLAEMLHTDYGAFGVYFIFILYFLRNQKIFRTIMGCVSILWQGAWEITAPLAFIPIHFYNGKRGINLKYIFYLFYPTHLMIVYMIRILFH